MFNNSYFSSCSQNNWRSWVLNGKMTEQTCSQIHSPYLRDIVDFQNWLGNYIRTKCCLENRRKSRKISYEILTVLLVIYFVSDIFLAVLWMKTFWLSSQTHSFRVDFLIKTYWWLTSPAPGLDVRTQKQAFWQWDCHKCEVSAKEAHIYFKCTYPPRQLFNMHDISNNKNGIHFLPFSHQISSSGKQFRPLSFQTQNGRLLWINMSGIKSGQKIKRTFCRKFCLLSMYSTGQAQSWTAMAEKTCQDHKREENFCLEMR